MSESSRSLPATLLNLLGTGVMYGMVGAVVGLLFGLALWPNEFMAGRAGVIYGFPVGFAIGALGGDEPQSRRTWLLRAVVTVVLLTSYYTLHRATFYDDWGEEPEEAGSVEYPQPGFYWRRHTIGQVRIPKSFEAFFLPALWFDDLIGVGPLHR
jgi:hypothetical protein